MYSPKMCSLSARLKSFRKHAEAGAMALIPALIFVIIALGLVSFMTVATIKSVEKGQLSQDMGSSLNAADSGIANMMTLANSARYMAPDANPVFESYLGPEHARYGKYNANDTDEDGDGSYSWRWYAERATASSTGTTYYVYATGYQKTPDEESARTIRVTVSSVTTEGVSYDNAGGIAYIATKAGSFGFNGLGTSLVEMGDNTSANVYDSSTNIGYPLTTTAQGKIGTSGTIDLGSSVNTQISFLIPGSVGSSSQEMLNSLCSGNGCRTANSSLYNYAVSLSASRTEALKACPNSSYPDWIASEHNGEVPYSSDTMCYNNIIFDKDTTLSKSWSTGNPAVMYAQGSITVKPGVEVAKQTSTSQGPFTLQIISTGNTTFTMERGTAVDPTKFTGVVAGSSLTCDIGGSSTDTTANTANLYGSVACKTLRVKQGASLWWDSQLEKVLKQGSSNAKRIWATTDYEEV